MSKLLVPTTPVSVCPADDHLLRAPLEPPRSHGRATRAHGVIVERTGVINAQARRAGGVERSPPGYNCFVSPPGDGVGLSLLWQEILKSGNPSTNTLLVSANAAACTSCSTIAAVSYTHLTLPTKA